MHQFVVLTHTLTSHIATLAHFSKTLAVKYQSQDFVPIIAETTQNLVAAAQLEEDIAEATLQPEEKISPFILSTHIKELVAKRNHELEQGLTRTDTRLRLSELKPIVDQFQFIASIAADIRKAAEGKTV